MPSGKAILTIGGTTGTAHFANEGVVANLTVTNPVPPATGVVSVEYSSTDDLTGSQAFTGTVGPAGVDISISNGPTIKGALQDASPSEHVLSGLVNWTSA
ncbi:hypothetical protein AWENTII_009346 [Aspergillus wentii]|nr:hypothetical protein MW887_001069 [Aspergillus wentii]